MIFSAMSRNGTYIVLSAIDEEHAMARLIPADPSDVTGFSASSDEVTTNCPS
jgi:hypothetical protein